MRFHIQFREFPGALRSPARHPVAARKEISLTGTRSDNRSGPLPVTTQGFDLDDPEVVALELRFSIRFPLGEKTYTVLKIIQEFKVQDSAPIGAPKPSLLPHRWLFEDPEARDNYHAHLGQHPLLEYDNARKQITLNCLVVNFTELWKDTHKNNRRYKVRELLWPNNEVHFRVLAHLGGPPFIWFASIPQHLVSENEISPHVFFQPIDNAEEQRIFGDSADNFGEKDVEYLRDGVRERFEKDGLELTDYLLHPVPDEDATRLSRPFAELDFILQRFRNVVTTIPVPARAKRMVGKPQPDHWNIRAGFERALLGTGAKKPKQLLLIPQRPKNRNTPLASGPHLRHAVEAIMKVLWSNDALFAQRRSSTDLTVGKLVLSCFSQSGVDLWEAATHHMDRIKAVIAIEPQNFERLTNKEGNKLGVDVIPKLVERKIPVFVIGRFQPAALKGVQFLPENPGKFFTYPPDPAQNDFIRYRVSRLQNLDSDPLMLFDEKKMLEDAQAALPPGSSLYRHIFHDEHNVDQPQSGITHWYSHQFALSGGRIMKLPEDAATKGIYARPVEYKTFFQECVEEIG